MYVDAYAMMSEEQYMAHLDKVKVSVCVWMIYIYIFAQSVPSSLLSCPRALLDNLQLKLTCTII
jgi:hypothetical protein